MKEAKRGTMTLFSFPAQGRYGTVIVSQGITALSPTLRIVHFNTLNLTETRQVFPLAPPEQPQGGYRLAYWLLDGVGFTERH